MQLRLVLPGELQAIKEGAALCGEPHASTWVRGLALQAAAEVRRSGKDVVITLQDIKEAAALCGETPASAWVRDLARQAEVELRKSDKRNVIITTVVRS